MRLSRAPAKNYSENNRPAPLGAVRDFGPKIGNPINVREFIGYLSISAKFGPMRNPIFTIKDQTH